MRILPVFLQRALWCPQTCPSYTAGYTGATPIHDSSSGKIYVNEASIHRAQCAGTVFAWHYCYYDNRRTNNLEVAFGVYEAVGEEAEIGQLQPSLR